MLLRCVLAVISVCQMMSGSAAALQQLRVAAAADLTFAMQELASAYKTKSGVEIAPTFSSSGNLFAQIENGAPFDLYFSADIDYPRRLEYSGNAVRGSLRKYAIGTLVLWAPNGSGIDLRKGMEALDSPAVKKIAIANPETAPYGRAAAAALRFYKLDQRLASKIVRGDSVSQAAQFVQSGNAQIGFIGEALALSPTLKSKGTFFVVPQESYPALEQGAVVIARSQQREAALKFLDFVMSNEGQAILAKYGFEPPEQSR